MLCLRIMFKNGQERIVKIEADNPSSMSDETLRKGFSDLSAGFSKLEYVNTDKFWIRCGDVVFMELILNDND
jgi:hypothetical protein